MYVNPNCMQRPTVYTPVRLYCGVRVGVRLGVTVAVRVSAAVAVAVGARVGVTVAVKVAEGSGLGVTVGGRGVGLGAVVAVGDGRAVLQPPAADNNTEKIKMVASGYLLIFSVHPRCPIKPQTI